MTDMLTDVEIDQLKKQSTENLRNLGRALSELTIKERKEDKARYDKVKLATITFLTNISDSIREFADQDIPEAFEKKFPRAFMDSKSLAKLENNDIAALRKMLSDPGQLDLNLLLNLLEGKTWDADKLVKEINTEYTLGRSLGGGKGSFPGRYMKDVQDPSHPKKLFGGKRFIAADPYQIAPKFKTLLIARIEKEKKKQGNDILLTF